MKAAELKAMKLATMGCWWPSPPYTPPDAKPDWAGITNELVVLANDALFHRDDMEEYEGLKHLGYLAQVECAKS